MILEVKNLSVSYGGIKALTDVSLAVDEGEIVSIIGANGAGKSTILRAISGLTKISAGEIWFQGKRIDGISASSIIRMGIAHVPEGRMLFGTMTVLDNLKMGAYIRKNRIKIIEDMNLVYEQFPIFLLLQD